MHFSINLKRPNFFIDMRKRKHYLRINKYVLTQEIHFEKNSIVMKCIDTAKSDVRAIRVMNRDTLVKQLRSVGLLDHLTLMYFISFQQKLVF